MNMDNIQVNLFPALFGVDYHFNSRFLHLLDCLKLSSILLLNATMQKHMFFNCITYSILQIIFIEFFHIHQDSIQRPEITNLGEDELTFLLENFPLAMGLLDSDLNVGWAEVRNSAILKRSLGLIWMDLFRMKDNFEFLVEDIDKVTSTYFCHFEFKAFISGERYDDSFEENNYLTLAEKIFLNT